MGRHACTCSLHRWENINPQVTHTHTHRNTVIYCSGNRTVGVCVCVRACMCAYICEWDTVSRSCIPEWENRFTFNLNHRKRVRILSPRWKMFFSYHKGRPAWLIYRVLRSYFCLCADAVFCVYVFTHVIMSLSYFMFFKWVCCSGQQLELSFDFGGTVSGPVAVWGRREYEALIGQTPFLHAHKKIWKSEMYCTE